MPRDLARARPKLVSSRYKPCRRAKHDDYATLLENFQSHHVYLFACFLLVGIGKGTADKIHEYLSTGKSCVMSSLVYPNMCSCANFFFTFVSFYTGVIQKLEEKRLIHS